MRIMISQPMRGLTTEQICERREVVVAELEAQGHTVVDTVFASSPEEAANKPVWYLGEAIKAMSTVDAVYFMRGWTNARGCIIEHQICLNYGIHILES